MNTIPVEIQQSEILAFLATRDMVSLSLTSSSPISPRGTTKSWPTYIPAPPNKRRSEKDRHSRDGRKHRKPGKGGKIRHGGRHHLDSVC
jgi:hypothetical protein